MSYVQHLSNFRIGSNSTYNHYGIFNYLPIKISCTIPYEMQEGFHTKT